MPSTGDDLREYHPAYARLMFEEPLVMPERTAPVSGGLVRLVIHNQLNDLVTRDGDRSAHPPVAGCASSTCFV